jgi:hypothetical protein
VEGPPRARLLPGPTNQPNLLPRSHLFFAEQLRHSRAVTPLADNILQVNDIRNALCPFLSIENNVNI